ncbi:amidohydrolase [Halomonas binhaiensis]|uniref:Amidohydrolase n=1 Tax=Halomonas binhaiensis TaxID=2562282 RepID=A0A5C1NNI9_9GAMM|nr:amidohydrolase [Halomonas binhaiensis]QEM83379.1 amidohydrolase [Halomonas binhaiensis]
MRWNKILLGISLASASLGAQAASSLLVNANGYGFDENRQLVAFSTLYLEDGKVVARGGESLAEQYPEAEQRIDVQGKTLIPGLIDAHTHLMGLGYSLLEADLRDLDSAEESAAAVAEFATEHPDFEWLRGGGWNQELWDGKQFPTAADLDAHIADRPVVLQRVDGHAIWVNSRAMELAGIDADSQAPEGGEILRDESGQPTGVFIDNAEALITDKIPARTEAEMSEAYDTAVKHVQQLGITGVHIAGASSQELDFYRQRKAQESLGIRLYPMISAKDDKLEEWLEQGIIDDPEDWLDIRSIKIFADGALGSRGAALTDPYSDRPDSRGLLIEDEDTLAGLVDKAVQHGFQANMHAIGDRANNIALNIYQAQQEQTPQSRDLRHRIEHAQVASVDDIPRFAELGVIPSMQPTHATSDKNMAGDRLGEERLAGAYAWRYFLDSGSHIAGGSDFPVEPANPFYGLHAAVTRQDRDGQPPGGWLPGQKLTMAEALRSFTADAAFAAHQEESLGSLLPNQWADFIIIDKDIIRDDPATVSDTQVLETWISGKPIHQSEDAPSQEQLM